MSVEMSVKNIPDHPSKHEVHEREKDRFKEQCENCKSYKPGNKHNGCEIRWKLINDDSKVAWKSKHLFMTDNYMCKAYRAKV